MEKIMKKKLIQFEERHTHKNKKGRMNNNQRGAQQPPRKMRPRPYLLTGTSRRKPAACVMVLLTNEVHDRKQLDLVMDVTTCAMWQMHRAACFDDPLHVNHNSSVVPYGTATLTPCVIVPDHETALLVVAGLKRGGIACYMPIQ